MILFEKPAPTRELDPPRRRIARPEQVQPTGDRKFLVYQAEESEIKIQTRLAIEKLWLTQQLMPKLFQTTKQSIGPLPKKILDEGKPNQNAVMKNRFTTTIDGKKYSTRQ